MLGNLGQIYSVDLHGLGSTNISGGRTDLDYVDNEVQSDNDIYPEDGSRLDDEAQLRYDDVQLA